MAKLLFFGPLSDVLEIESMTVPVPGEVKTIRDLVNALHQRGSRWQRYLDPQKLQITRNRQFCDADSEIADSDEIAFISKPGSI